MKKLVIAAFLCCVAVGLSACGDIPIENQIYAAQSTLTVAERGALAYVDQPLCGTEEAEGASICSKPSIIKKIGVADESAQTAIKAAKEAQTEEALGIAQTAINALLEITNTILEGI